MPFKKRKQSSGSYADKRTLMFTTTPGITFSDVVAYTGGESKEKVTPDTEAKTKSEQNADSIRLIFNMYEAEKKPKTLSYLLLNMDQHNSRFPWYDSRYKELFEQPYLNPHYATKDQDQEEET